MIIGVGTDIIKHSRVNLKIAKKLFTEAEMEKFSDISEELKLEHVASRFAAKEAIIKATNKQFLFNDIEITNDDSGKPVCNIDGIELSISHEQDYSVAFAIYQK